MNLNQFSIDYVRFESIFNRLPIKYDDQRIVSENTLMRYCFIYIARTETPWHISSGHWWFRALPPMNYRSTTECSPMPGPTS